MWKYILLQSHEILNILPHKIYSSSSYAIVRSILNPHPYIFGDIDNISHTGCGKLPNIFKQVCALLLFPLYNTTRPCFGDTHSREIIYAISHLVIA